MTNPDGRAVESFSDEALRNIIAQVNQNGLYGFWIDRARKELSERSYRAYLEQQGSTP